MDDLTRAQDFCADRATIRVMVDHAEQIKALNDFNATAGRTRSWSVFIKVDGGGKWVIQQPTWFSVLTPRRAGAPPSSTQMRDLIVAAHESPAAEIFGFYSRACTSRDVTSRLINRFWAVIRVKVRSGGKQLLSGGDSMRQRGRVCCASVWSHLAIGPIGGCDTHRTRGV